MITITTMRIVWLLRAETTTTTMLRLSSACVLRFTRSQNSVSFPVFAKLFAQTSICELIDLSMKGLTILPFIIFKRRNKLDLSATDFLLWNELEKVVELFFYTPHSLITTYRANFLVRKLARLQSIRFLRPNAKSRFLMPHKKAILWGPHFVLWSDL